MLRLIPKPDSAERDRCIQAACIQAEIARQAFVAALLEQSETRRARFLREGESAARLAHAAALDASLVMGGKG